MRALVTAQGTAAAETGLCDSCYSKETHRAYARNQATTRLRDGANPFGDFVECSDNNAVSCCVCGHRSD